MTDHALPGGGLSDEVLRDQLVAYALGTADESTRAAVERAVASSESVAKELDELMEVGALLALTSEPRTPPPGLRERILASAAQARPDLPASSVEPPPLAVLRASPDRAEAGQGPAPSGAERERVLAPAPRWTIGGMAPWMLAAASLIGIVLIGRGLSDERAARQVAEGQRDGLLVQVAELDSLVATLTASDLSTVRLSSTGAPPSARLYWNRERGEVLLAAFRLPPAPTGRTYQLWGIAEGQAPVSLGTFSAAGEGRNVVRFRMPAGLQLAVGAVTEEPAGGSPQPTSAPFLAGTLRETE